MFKSPWILSHNKSPSTAFGGGVAEIVNTEDLDNQTDNPENSKTLKRTWILSISKPPFSWAILANT